MGRLGSEHARFFGDVSLSDALLMERQAAEHEEPLGHFYLLDQKLKLYLSLLTQCGMVRPLCVCGLPLYG